MPAVSPAALLLVDVNCQYSLKQNVSGGALVLLTRVTSDRRAFTAGVYDVSRTPLAYDSSSRSNAAPLLLSIYMLLHTRRARGMSL